MWQGGGRGGRWSRRGNWETSIIIISNTIWRGLWQLLSYWRVTNRWKSVDTKRHRPPTDQQADSQTDRWISVLEIFVVVKCVGNHLHLNWSILVYSLFINGWSFHCQMAASKLNKLCSTNAECRTKPFSFLFESIFGISAQFLSWARQQCGIQLKLSLDGNKGLTAVMKTQSERHREGGDVRKFCNFARDIIIRKTNLTNIKQLYLNLEGLQLSSNGPNSQMH